MVSVLSRRVFSALAVVLASAAAAGSAAADTVFVASSNNQLLRYDTSTPASPTAVVALTGLQSGETLRGMDFRPADGRLYAVSTTNRVYTIDTGTGVATAAGPAFTPPATGTRFGIDFNPVPDRIRVVSDADESLRLNPVNGALAGTDSTLAYVAGDPGGANPTIVAAAYSNNVAGTALTTLFVIDAATGRLVRQGGPDGTPSPNLGQLTSVGSLGFMPADSFVHFDISAVGTAFAVADPGTGATLYTVNLTTGVATPLGPLGGLSGATPAGLAVAPAGTCNFAAPSIVVTESGGTATLTVNRTGTFGSATVSFATSDGTAAAGADYSTASGVLTFAEGEASKTIQVPLIDDALSVGVIGFNVTLSAATGGAVVGSTSRSGVVVIDNEMPVPQLVGVAGGNTLVRFSAAAPATILSSIAITGLQAGETVLGLDFRPLNGQLVAVGSTSRVYTINPATGAATAIGGAPISPLLDGTSFGVDFNPVPDRLRVVSDRDQSLRLNQITGAIAGVDATLAYAPGDIAFGQDPNVSAAAYTNSFAGTATTTLFGLDFGRDTLVRQGGPDGVPSPNGGQLTTIGPLGVDTSSVASLDIVPNGPAFALLKPASASASSLYLVNLTNGATVLVGAIGQNITVQEIASDPNVDSDLDGLTDLFELRFGLNALVNDAGGDPDNDGVSNLQEFQAGSHPRGFFTRYLAEGATSSFFDTFFAMLNPGTTAATVLARFQKTDGTSATQLVQLPGLRRATLNAKNAAALATAEFSTFIESDVQVVVDRTMSFDSTGYGSHAETAIASPGLIWYLAEGSTTFNFSLFYLLQNPGTVDANVEVTFLLPAPAAPLVRNYTVQAGRRFNVFVNLIPELASTDVSAVIRSTNNVPIVVERAMYLDRNGQLFSAGHAAAAIPAPATTWNFAEGATGPFFDTFLLLSAPGDVDAQVSVLYRMPGGATVTKSYTVAANSRKTVWVDFEDPLLADTAVAFTATSVNGVPFLAERAMWFPGPTPATWNEAHASSGATSTGMRWALAEGEAGGARATETYILVGNASASDGSVRVTLYFEDGSTATKMFPSAANSRINVNVGVEFPSAVGRRFGAIVESVGATPAPIFVERSVYSAVGGVPFVAGTNAVATKLQ